MHAAELTQQFQEAQSNTAKSRPTVQQVMNIHGYIGRPDLVNHLAQVGLRGLVVGSDSIRAALTAMGIRPDDGVADEATNLQEKWEALLEYIEFEAANN